MPLSLSTVNQYLWSLCLSSFPLLPLFSAACDLSDRPFLSLLVIFAHIPESTHGHPLRALSLKGFSSHSA